MSNTHKGPERRKFERVAASFIITYQIDKPLMMRLIVGKRQASALMLDVSEGGMSIITDYDIPVSTVLLIKFTLINVNVGKNERVTSMDVTGEVRYNILSKKNEHKLGIRFIRIDAKSRQVIGKLARMITGK